MDNKTWWLVGAGVGLLLLAFIFLRKPSSSSGSGVSTITTGLTGSQATRLALAGINAGVQTTALQDQLTLGQAQINASVQENAANNAAAYNTALSNNSALESILSNISAAELAATQNTNSTQLALAKTNDTALQQIVANEGSTAVALQPSPTQGILGALGNLGGFVSSVASAFGL